MNNIRKSKLPLHVFSQSNMKIQQTLRRLLLGNRYKHQCTCHPKFNLKRHKKCCEIAWDNEFIANIKFAEILQNTFKGSCFTFATGPSLNNLDLSKISKIDTISLNCAIKKFIASNQTPTHCIIVDRRIFENEWECVEASILSGANCFFSYVGLSKICERDPSLLRHGNIYLIESTSRKFGIPRPSIEESKKFFRLDPDFFLDPELLDYCRSIGFSTSLEKGVFSGKTVATWATQLAFALGYKNNFIIGMDLGGTGKKHFYAEENNGAPDFIKDYEPYIRACFELARKVCDKNGWGIYNLSPKSTLPNEILKKISLEEALKIAHISH